MQFIKAKDMTRGTEVNVQVRHIVSFEPAQNDEKTTVLRMINGQSYTVDKTCRMVRHAIKDTPAGES